VRSVFFAFRDAPERRAALRAPGALDRYRLFGLDEISARGVAVRHNLEREGPPPWTRATGGAVNQLVHATGGYGGDFAGVFGSLRAANTADVVFATADTVGIPLTLLKRAGLLRPPLVYTAIGLPERLAQLGRGRTRKRYAAALRHVRRIVVYSLAEAKWLREWVGSATPAIEFVPFGVDVEAFRPADEPTTEDVVSVGADPRRDFRLLTAIAARHPELSFRIVTTAEHRRELGKVPGNVAIETDLTLEQVRDRLAHGRVVALPVYANSYSGATTVLLQALAMAKPVVVSRTDAIANGYGLEDGVNCRLVEPGDTQAFEQALIGTLADAGDLGRHGRELVVREFTWERYTDRLWEILSATWDREHS
jgi:glycosyltransferase involved in cell wall biosynthesis